MSDGTTHRRRHVHLDGHAAGEHGAGRRLGHDHADDARPRTSTLTANVTSHDAEGDPLTTSYQWTRNGLDIAGATGATLDLALAGNGDRGDLIRVSVTVNDGSLRQRAGDSRARSRSSTARPVFSTDLQDRSDVAGGTANLDADASDPDGDTLDLQRHRPARRA